MKRLVQYCNQRGLKRVVERVVEFDYVQGVIIDFNPEWFVYQLSDKNLINSRDLANIVFGDVASQILDGFSMLLPEDFDLDQRVELQNGFLSAEKVSIVLKPGTLIDENLRQIQRDAEELTIVFEHRPLAKLAGDPKKVHNPLIGGISIGNGLKSAGTLGGLLEENGDYYGVTCSHIIHNKLNDIDQPAEKDSSSSRTIGKILHQDILKTSTQPCNPYLTNSDINKFDTALIELDSSISADLEVLDIGNIDGCFSKNQLTPFLAVEMTGRTSKYQNLRVGGIAVIYRFKDQNKNTLCFENLFEVKRTNSLIHKFRKPVKQGDSGAWVTAQGPSGTEWCGMIIGKDNTCGFAMNAEDVLSHLNSETGLNLKCY